MGKTVTKVQVLEKTKKLLGKERYKNLDVYLFGSVASRNWSQHDVDILKPTYGTLKQNKRFMRFRSELSKELKGFPVQATTFRILRLKKGQIPFAFKRKQGYIQLKKVV